MAAMGCAPRFQGPLSPAANFAGPRLEADAAISFDGARLGLQTWLPPAGEAPWAAILAVHGMSEYSDAWHLAGPWWAEQGIAVYAIDQRGFGRSPEPGRWAGSEVMAQDVLTVLALLRERHPNVVVAAVGQSMGAATLLIADEMSPEPLADRVVLSAPAVRGWSVLPWPYRVSLQLAARIAPGRSLRPPRGLNIRASDNDEALYRNGRDPLFLHDTRIDTLFGLVSHMEAAYRAAPGEDGPTFLIYGANDQVIPASAVEALAARLGPCGRSALYEEGWHMLFRDRQARLVWADVAAFLRDPAPSPPSGAPPVGEARAQTISPPCRRYSTGESNP